MALNVPVYATSEVSTAAALLASKQYHTTHVFSDMYVSPPPSRQVGGVLPGARKDGTMRGRRESDAGQPEAATA